MLFLRQVGALCVKNWIILARHPFVSIFRCIVGPIAIAILLAYAQFFTAKPNNNGLGTMIPVFPLADTFDDSLYFPWVDNTNGTGALSADDIMARVTRGFSGEQLGATRKLTKEEMSVLCTQNPSSKSQCFAGIIFEHIGAADSNFPVNYTIIADSSLGFVDVRAHKSDYEQRILPLQWAVESAIIELETGVTPETPLEWPYTFSSPDEDTDEDVRLGYLGWINLLMIPFFICFSGIAYHIPGSATSERASGMTSHMKAMGLMDSARVVSWHLSISLAYLPAWIVIAVIWKVKLFTATNFGLILATTLLTGLSLASWSMFIMAPFGKSPTLAAIMATLLALVPVVISMFFYGVSTSLAAVLVLLFPTFFFPLVIEQISYFEADLLPGSATAPNPQTGPIFLWPMFITVVISIFLWPAVGAWIERWKFDPPNPSGTLCYGKREKGSPPPPNVAISIKDLNKSFQTSVFRRKKGLVTAITDLTLDIPKSGIFVLLGPNGAGKSTLMSILGGLTGVTRGTVTFEGGAARPPRGSIGIVPQKNVLFPELTCLQNLRVWSAIKPQQEGATQEEDQNLVLLLRDCDLVEKVHYDAGALSGGQKRKLQLAIGLVGGSNIVLVDEATSGVDPLSRRAIWKTLNRVRNDRTIVFTTHFLDEADLLADDIAVLDTPGKLVAHGSPLALKAARGDGYKIRATFLSATEKAEIPEKELLEVVRRFAPQASATVTGPSERMYHLKTADPRAVKKVLEEVEKAKESLHISTYAVSAASIEDIFLDLMHNSESNEAPAEVADDGSVASELASDTAPVHTNLELSSSTHRSVFAQALTIFYKRLLILRRSWLSPLLALAFIFVTCIIPLIFVEKDGTGNACASVFPTSFTASVLYQESFLSTGFVSNVDSDNFLVTPPGLLTALGNDTASALGVTNIQDNATFVNDITEWYPQEIFAENGGVSVDLSSGASLFLWSVDSIDGFEGPILLNLVSNLLLNKALNDTGRALSDGSPKFIAPRRADFPAKSQGNLSPLQWAAVFGAAMGVFPAFFTLYVARERQSAVQAMQFSNGISNPAGLWLGHLLFDSMFSTLASTVLVIVYAAKFAYLFSGLGYLWFIMVLYGIAGNLFAYCITLLVKSPLGAWAAVAVYQIIVFLLYLMGYLLATTYDTVNRAQQDLTAIHFTLALISPLPSLVRAGFVTVNIFSLLCVGDTVLKPSLFGSITHYGGPILYLILYSFALFAILVYADSGSPLRSALLRFRSRGQSTQSDAEAKGDTDDALRVMDVSKSFGKGRVVDGVSFSVGTDTIFALLGPNGAGKTTTFNMIRGDIAPSSGSISINGHSVVAHTQAARLALGVCPQFTAVDAQLNVREHLALYAALKGVPRGAPDVARVLAATGLAPYAERLANKLSGGNQRKLALAIALLGNPSVVLIDEFSTGVDAKMKRDMWSTLKHVAPGKAIVITTHSMEEASTLANKVGIISRRMLTVDSTEALLSRHARYLVHFQGRTPADVARAEALVNRIPGARMADDVATRFEVPIRRSAEGGEGMSLAELFGLLAEAGAGDYAVEEASLESVFMQVIRENDGAGGDSEGAKRKWWMF